MKKLLLLTLSLLIAATSFAQETEATNDKPEKRFRKKFFNISYSSSELSPKSDILIDDGMGEMVPLVDANFKLKSDWGVSIVRGRTYRLHRKPLANLVNIGIDVSFLDLNYSQFTMNAVPSNNSPSDSEGSTKIHKIDYGWQVGPSISLTPGRRFTITAYFRYAPTFSSIYVDDSYMGNYSTQFRTGASFSYGVIGLGMEASFGDCKYKNFVGDLDLGDTKIKSSGYRVYLQFRW